MSSIGIISGVGYLLEDLQNNGGSRLYDEVPTDFSDCRSCGYAMEVRALSRDGKTVLKITPKGERYLENKLREEALGT